MSNNFSHLFLLLKKLGIGLLIFSVCRILFYLFNSNYFSDVSINLFVSGIRFDLVAVSYLFLPLIIFSVLPFSFRSFRPYQIFLTVLFYLGNTIGIILNLIDVAYFDFTLKRTTTDLFSTIGADNGSDFTQLFYLYIVDFWYDYILLIGLILLSRFLYKKYCITKKKFHPYSSKDYLIHSVICISISGLMVIAARGGFQYKPIAIINAGQYATAQNVPIVLNTPFTVIKTLFNNSIQTINYYEEKDLISNYNPVKKIEGEAPFKGKNIVVIILESFAKEYIGILNNGNGYTPFLDSLISNSYLFNNAYSNGYKSIDALPSIFAGIPSLMNTPFIVSNFAGNKIEGFPQIVKNMGYNTSFYHGGANGTMGFNGFVGSAGIKNYYGLNEYPLKEKDYDGSWGIFDEPYLQYYASELSSKPTPFFSAVFTLSSHHPYSIPKEYVGKFPKGNLPIHETIGYTDHSLKKFFKTIKKTSWYKNTLFLFTSDHSSKSEYPHYRTHLGRFAIPIFIFDPSKNLIGKSNEIFQQIDIMPTLLGLIGSKEKTIAFGNNAFDNSEKFVVNYINSSYQIRVNDHFLIFNGESSTALYNVKTDSLMTTNLLNVESEKATKNKLENKLKAIIQQYNNRLINNNLSIK